METACGKDSKSCRKMALIVHWNGIRESKIEKKQSEIEILKAKAVELKAQKTKIDYQDLIDYMQANKLTAEEVLACIKD